MTEGAKRAVLVVGAVFFSLLLAGGGYEVVSRLGYARWRKANEERLAGILLVRSENPRLLWENRPGLVAENYTINRWGFRDVDLDSKAKPRGVYRIAFVGDSVTFGDAVKQDELFVSLIGQTVPLIRERRTQMLNFSVEGYNALQIDELIRARVMEFEPDLVVYVLCLNDFDFDDASGGIMRYFRPPASFVWERLNRARAGRSAREYHEDYFSKNHDEVFSAIRRMRQAVVGRGSEFEVVIVPVFDLSIPSFREYGLGDIHDGIARFLDGEHIRSLDLLSTFRACTKLSPWAYALDVWHLNRLGHRFVARALEELVPTGYVSREVSESTCAELTSLESSQLGPDTLKFDATLSSGAEVRLPIDSPFLQLEGFWSIEHDSRRALTWSRETSVIEVAQLREGTSYRITLLVADSAGRHHVEVGQKGIALVAVVVDGAGIQVPAPITADASGHLSVQLHTETFQPSARGSTDTRQLGVALSGVVVQIVGR